LSLGTSVLQCVDADSLNVRSGPGTSYSVRRSISKGDVVNVVSYSGSWAKLDDGNYVHSSYLAACSGRKLCTTASLNVRNAPVSGSILRVLPSGTSVTVYASSNGWATIGANEYVSESYLGQCSSGPSPPKPAPSGDTVSITLKKVLGSEGKCQNWSEDSGNWFNGKLGYTCAGITPSVGYAHRNGAFAYASGCQSRSAEMFVKCAWDTDESAFIAGAGEVYTNNYFRPGGCADFPQPLHYVCSDIAVNSGTGRSKQYIRELGSVSGDYKGYARRMNEMHRQDYIRWSAPGTANARFRQGWLNRAAERDRFIDQY